MPVDFLEENIVYEHSELGSTISSRVPSSYRGVTQLEAVSRKTSIAVFPTYEQALSAAKFAVGPMGGYQHAVLTRGTAPSITHTHWEDWAFEY